VGTRVDGVPEMVQAGVNGLLVPLDDREALTAALKKLIDDPGLRREMGQAGLRFCRDEGRFSADTMALRAETNYVRWLTERKS
jgi:glycosyltransferase involved in cell wall biosynthesis